MSARQRVPKGNPMIPVIGELDLYEQRVLLHLIHQAGIYGEYDKEKNAYYIAASCYKIAKAIHDDELKLTPWQVDRTLIRLEREGFIRIVPGKMKKGSPPKIYLINYKPNSLGVRK